jgi:hypothetical protein
MAVLQAARLPDWRDAAAYAPLLKVERAGFAWEWLRRNAEYRTAANEAIAARLAPWPRLEENRATLWGLHAFADPHLDAPAARPVWRAELHDLVLSADGEPCASGADAFVLEPLVDKATVIEGAGVQHLLLSNGCRSIRMDVIGVDLLSGPVRLHYRLSGMETVDGPLLALRRLLALVRGADFSRALHPAEVRAARLVSMLRAHDAVQAAASQREIAAVLLSAEAGEERWRVRAPSLRSQAQRLVRGAASMARDQGYLALLTRSGASRRA